MNMMVDFIMQNLLSKDVLYGPLKVRIVQPRLFAVVGRSMPADAGRSKQGRFVWWP